MSKNFGANMQINKRGTQNQRHGKQYTWITSKQQKNKQTIALGKIWLQSTEERGTEKV